MDYRKSRNLMTTGFIVGILIMVIGVGIENEIPIEGFFISGTAIFLAAWLQAFVFYRCPHCGYLLLNVRGGIPGHCPECGEEL